KVGQFYWPKVGQNKWPLTIDMENALIAHPRIRDAAVVGIEHPKWQERPVALLVTDDGTELPLDEIHEVLKPSFAKWQLPDTALFLETLPRTSVGKLDKKSIRATYKDIYKDI
uniref:AMP-binding enzyme n=1 Tax=Marinobacter sp. OP 3.4 TaxID=3076501 RepID=UPI003FA5390B